ncbi:MAG: HEAT repeat domain-containing protein [Candidatus Acidiferrales bacterium]
MSGNLPEPVRDGRVLTCEDVKPMLVFCACGELDAEENTAVMAHTAACAACAAELREERALRAVLSDLPQPADRLDPAGVLLSQCRSELGEKLDDWEAQRALSSRRPLRWFRRWMVLRPAWSAALLALMGAGLGVVGLEWARSGGAKGVGNAVNVLATPRLSDQDLANMAVAGVSMTPAAAGNQPAEVQLRLRAQRPMVISGSLDDGDVRRVLTYVVENGRQFDPGVRLDCLDALRMRAADAGVRRTLVAAARKDQNPAVRLRALEALQNVAGDQGVRDVFVDALMDDPNPGVRVEAVNSLVRSIENRAPDAPGSLLSPEDRRVLRALEGLTRNDPNNYVRLQSAAALRQLEPRELH